MTRETLLAFDIGDICCGLPLAIVDRVEAAAAVDPLPGAPPVVLGVLDYKSEVLPVVSLRNRFALPDRPLEASDYFIIVRRRSHRATEPSGLVLAVDRLAGFRQVDAYLDRSAVPGLEPGVSLPVTEAICGIARTADGLVLIQDLGRLLSSDDEAALRRALHGKRARS